MCSKELPRLNRAGNVGARQISAQRGSWRGRGAHTLLPAQLCISVKRSARLMFFYLIIAVALLADDIASEESPTSSTAPGRQSATTDQEMPFLTPPRSEPHCRSSRAGHWPVSCLFCVGLPEMLLAAICSPPHSARACSPATCAIDSSPVAAWSLRGRSCGPMMRARSCGWLLPFHAMMSRWSLGSGVPPYPVPVQLQESACSLARRTPCRGALAPLH